MVTTDTLQSQQSSPADPAKVAGYVYDTESGSAVDGPGIRYVIFLAGCPLQCKYCHNPDSMHMKKGVYKTVNEVMTPVKSSAAMLRRMKGGLTISGGEPMVQPNFVHVILKEAKAVGLHTALDTSGFLGNRVTDEMLESIDLVLLDIKSMQRDTYKNVTGVELEPTLAFAKRLAEKGKPVWIRFVLVPGLTDAADNIRALGEFVAGLGNVERLEVLPFHKLGEHKWEHTDRQYELRDTPAPMPEQVAAVRRILKDCGVKMVV